MALPAFVRFVFTLTLRIYRAIGLLVLRLRGYTPDSHAERQVVTGAAWNEFCDTLKAAGAAMVAPGTPKDGFNQAEGCARHMPSIKLKLSTQPNLLSGLCRSLPCTVGSSWTRELSRVLRSRGAPPLQRAPEHTRDNPQQHTPHVCLRRDPANTCSISSPLSDRGWISTISHQARL